jgi:hypothetical protein
MRMSLISSSLIIWLDAPALFVRESAFDAAQRIALRAVHMPASRTRLRKIRLNWLATILLTAGQQTTCAIRERR